MQGLLVTDVSFDIFHDQDKDKDKRRFEVDRPGLASSGPLAHVIYTLEKNFVAEDHFPFRFMHVVFTVAVL